MGRTRFWKLGGRTWKTVAAVFVSLLVCSMRPGGLPFYAAITAIFCIQKNVQDSVETAVNREIATVIGGMFGMLFLMVEQSIGGIELSVLRYGFVSLMLVLIISVSVWLGRPKSTFLMCVVFLSVAIVHDVDVHPVRYAVNRILDTTIGIATALAMNYLPGKASALWRKGHGRRLDIDCEDDENCGEQKGCPADTTELGVVQKTMNGANSPVKNPHLVSDDT